jgi:putative tricarboxylic transport membrane protein
LFDAILEAAVMTFSLERLPFLLLGVTVGLAVGILPGLSGAAGMSILLPFVFGMDPYSGIAMLIGMAAVVHTADTFPSVLLGIPGSSGSQATIMDGYPLTQQGQAGRALSAAFGASMVGGILGAVALLAVLSVARPLILALGSPELFALTLFGLSMITVLSRGAVLAGATSATLGLLLGTVGAAPAAPVYRYTFDLLFLYQGISLPIIALAIFGLPEIIDLLLGESSISRTPRVVGGRLRGLKDVVKHRWLVVRSATMGAAFGAVPGLGGTVVDWLVYGITQQTTRGKTNFGQGDIRGVLGPESANNAKEGGALVPTLLFGIPGSANTAILLAGLVLMGMQAGPAMVGEHLGITLSVVWLLAIANILGALACLSLTNQVAKLSTIPAKSLAPFLVVLLVFASFQANARWEDVLLFLGLGILGLAMKRLSIPRPPLLIAFVLAPSAERYLWISMSQFGFSWVARPGVLIIGTITLVSVVAALASRGGKNATLML